MSSETPAKSDRPLIIGRYKILERIGSGGMGTVYKAVHLDLGREVALKVLPPNLARRPDTLERFHLEAKHASGLRHEHIVTLYEFGQASGTHFLAMEFVDGINLHEYINATGPLKPDLARELLLQAAKALAQAHKHGIVHRDIKPSNFLLTQRDGRPFVKLADFGLARNLDDPDFKVTRTGQTVGTVDYISPEQARNSRSADIRSDIYSLGCTLYHMLAGQPPFPEGDLTERLLKHVEAVPEDIRHFNADVPPGLVVVLDRMLAKKPEERYQTPAELLKDLVHLPSGLGLNPREWMAALALEFEKKPKPGRRAAPTLSAVPAQPGVIPKLQYRNRQPDVIRRKRTGNGTFHPLLVISGWKIWAALGTAAGLLILLVLALWLGWGTSQPGNNPVTAAMPTEAPEKPSYSIQNLSKDLRDESKEKETASPASKNSGSGKAQPPQPGRPRIRVPDKLVEDARQEFQPRETLVAQGNSPRPNPAQQPPGGGLQKLPPGRPADQPVRQPVAQQPVPVYVVSRLPARDGGNRADSLAGACALAAANKTVESIVVEIHDNGPLFETPVVVTGRNLVLRAGKGFRPLLCWDLGAKAASRSPHFISVTHGGLALENLDVVLRCSDDDSSDVAGLVRVQGGHLLTEGCTFSVTGRHAAGVAAIQLEGSRADGSSCVARLDHCYFRGAEMKLLDVKAPVADVVLDSCLAVGGYQPLFDIQSPAGAKPIKLRVARSTLVAGQTLLRVRRATSGDSNPAAVHWLGWDTLLAHYGSQIGGEMLDLQEGLQPTSLKWRAVNCLYTGWPTLLKWPGGTVAAADSDAWQKLWDQPLGDAVRDTTWPALLPADPCEVPPEAFRVVGTHTEFAATSGGDTIGCNVSSLPPGRGQWLAFTYDRVVPPPFYPSPTDQAPDNPSATDDAYYGERLDPTERDLGEHLKKIQATRRLGRMVVLRLAGKGEARTSPIHLQNVHLILYFEPQSLEKNRLVLVPMNAADHAALIEVEGGSLEIIGGKIRFPNNRNVPVPEYVLKVQDGDLRLSGCRLEGALEQAPKSYEGLIQFQGTRDAGAERAHECALANSVLLSGRTCVLCQGTGRRLRLQNCVVLAGTDAFRLDPGIRLLRHQNAWCILDHNSVAARRAVFHLADAAGPAASREPLIIQARANVFLSALAGADHRAGVLLCDAEALPHGLAVWQGEANIFDKQLHYYVASEKAPEARQSFATWERLWGTERQPERQLSLFKPEAKMLDLDRPQLNRLDVQALFPIETGTPPGANFEQLGIGSKEKVRSKK